MYAEIRDDQAAVQRQTRMQLVQLQQWHGAETRQMASEHAELVARVSRQEASAEAAVERLQAQHRFEIAALQQRCEQLLQSAKAEYDRVGAELRVAREQMEAFRKKT